MAKIVNLKQHLNSSSLITRQSARDLFNFVSQSKDNIVVLDFKDIEFASRSFFDEFNHNESKIALLGKKIEFINLNHDLSKLFKLVSDRSKVKSSISYSSVANADVISI